MMMKGRENDMQYSLWKEMYKNVVILPQAAGKSGE